MRSEQSRGQARSWWWAAAATVAAVGWVAALLTTPPSALIASAVVFAAFALLFSTGAQTTRENRGSAGATADWRRLVDHTVLGTVGAIAALGLLRVSVMATLLLAVVLAATATWAFSWRVPAVGGAASDGSSVSHLGVESGAATSRVTARETTAGPAPDPGPPTPAPDLGSMTTSELVMAWRRSYSQLLTVRSSPQLAAVAAMRQQLLDELERRDGAGVERWLRSGARAASDPSRFLQRPAGPSATSA